MNTQLHQHRLRGQYFSAYEKKPWYCDCAGTNIGCAGGTVKGDFQYRDLAYWKCELDARGLSKCGVSFCNACVMRDEKLRDPPSSQNSNNDKHQRVSAELGSGSQLPLAATNMSPQEFQQLQEANDNKDKNGLGANVYADAKIIKKGWMLKRGGVAKSWKRRYFVLRDDRQLYYYSNDKTSVVKGVAQFFDVEQIIKHDKQMLRIIIVFSLFFFAF